MGNNIAVKKIIKIFSLSFLVAGLITASSLVGQKQLLNNKAALTGGTTSITLDPVSGSLTPNVANTISLKYNATGVPVSGIAVKLSGLAMSDLVMDPGMSANDWSCPVKSISATTLEISCFNLGFSGFTPTSVMPLATFKITPTTDVNLMFDNNLTAIYKKSDGTDIAGIPNAGIYTLAVATPTPTPLATPTPTPLGASPAPLPTAKTTSEIIDNFDAAGLDLSRWNLTKYPTGSPEQTVQTDGKLKQVINAGYGQYVELNATTRTITGDFDVTVDLKSSGSTEGSAFTRLLFSDASGDNLFAIVLTNGGLLSAYSVLNKNISEQFTQSGLTQPITVRMVRVGNNIYFYSDKLMGTYAGIYTGDGTITLKTNTQSDKYPNITGIFDNFKALVNVNVVGSPNTCGGTCGSNANCQAGLVCYTGFCRNPQCKETANCSCVAPSSRPSGTPVGTSKPTPEVAEYTPAPLTKPKTITEKKIYDLDLEKPASTPAPKPQSFLGKIVGFFLKLFGIKY